MRWTRVLALLAPLAFAATEVRAQVAVGRITGIVTEVVTASRLLGEKDEIGCQQHMANAMAMMR